MSLDLSSVRRLIVSVTLSSTATTQTFESSMKNGLVETLALCGQTDKSTTSITRVSNGLTVTAYVIVPNNRLNQTVNSLQSCADSGDFLTQLNAHITSSGQVVSAISNFRIEVEELDRSQSVVTQTGSSFEASEGFDGSLISDNGYTLGKQSVAHISGELVPEDRDCLSEVRC